MYIHQAIPHGGGGLIVNSVFATRGEVVAFLDLLRPDTLGDSDHPEELVDVIARVANETTEHDEHIVDLVLLHDGVANFLTGAHGLADGGNMSVVPGVVVDKSGTVGHTTNLVTVVPPGHDLGGRLRVLAEPLIGLAVVVDDVL